MALIIKKTVEKKEEPVNKPAYVDILRRPLDKRI